MNIVYNKFAKRSGLPVAFAKYKGQPCNHLSGKPSLATLTFSASPAEKGDNPSQGLG